MPLPQKPSDESIPEFLHRTNLQEFQWKALLYSLGTLAAVAVWIALREEISYRIAVPVIGALALEAGKNIHRWWQWAQSQPRAGLVHPDRAAEIELETVKVMSDAVKARAWFTRGIIGCIAVPSFLELIVGLERAVEVASVDPIAVRRGEWWRLLGGTYLHGNIGHFAGNMGALFLYGSILESKASRLHVPLVYLLSALGGSLASVLVFSDVPSIGASGGVVGVISYLFLFSRRQSVKFPAAFHGATASVFIGLITAGALGFWYIDNAGHAGGAVTGFVLAGLLVDRARNFGEETSEPLVDLLGWIATAILVAGGVITCLALLR